MLVECFKPQAFDARSAARRRKGLPVLRLLLSSRRLSSMKWAGRRVGELMRLAARRPDISLCPSRVPGKGLDRRRHVPHDPVPVPLLAAGELRQVGLAECFCRHDVSLSGWPSVASADATLAVVETGVCSGQAESAGSGCGRSERSGVSPGPADGALADGQVPKSFLRRRRSRRIPLAGVTQLGSQKPGLVGTCPNPGPGKESKSQQSPCAQGTFFTTEMAFVGSNSRTSASLIAEETEKWGKVVKFSGAKAE
jgi:hypothetical protein